MNRYGLIIGTT